MKKNIPTLLIAATLLACNNPSTNGDNAQHDSASSSNSTAESSTGTSVFEIEKLPVSTADIGEFPFFTLPENLEYQNKPLKRDYDEIYFPLITNGQLVKIEGKSFKSYVVSKEETTWSLPYFLKSYDEAITSRGGQKVFEGKLNREQLDFLEANARYLGEEGSIDYWNDPVRTYVMRRANADDVYIQLYGNTASGSIQIVQKAALKQTISIIKSDEIKKDLAEKGKAVLYINFDTDKATLKPDGKSVVDEIAKVLQQDNGLKISIQGYTDNSGKKEHNQQLSENRALSVKNEIIKSGIAAERLNSKGFGQENPIADNSTEEGKAKNRRVELLKI